MDPARDLHRHTGVGLMRLLLDTRILFWAVADSALLKPSARRVIEAADQVSVSAASFWEIAIKVRIGKLKADHDPLAAALVDSGFKELPVRLSHACAVARLALRHNDPFDHLLVAQAITEPLKLLTADRLLGQYSDVVLVV